MLARVELGHADGILAWHPDRLARNSVDGGKIIYLVDSQQVKALKFPTFWFEATPQGKFMLNIAFGQSKYFVDNLSENTKRGLRQKLRRGEWPGWAPVGYLNDKLKHIVVPDPERAPLVRKLFERYATSKHSLKDIQNIAKSIGLFSRSGKVLSVSLIQSILSNPFYYGVFRYNGELYEAKHEPIITKKLFDGVQKVMANKAKPKKQHKVVEYPYRGLCVCAECGCAITSETQKGHHYYRCTKKRGACSQKYVREEVLTEQINDVIKKVSLPPSWADKMLTKLEEDREQEAQDGTRFAQNLKSEISVCDEKLEKLLDAHLDEMISKEEYVSKKQKLLNKKVEISEQLADFEHNGNYWLEPMRLFILDSKQAEIIAAKENLPAKRDFLKKIGSNPLLRDRALAVSWQNPWKILADFPIPLAVGEQNSEGYTVWLPLWDDVRTILLK
jgi:site-specific DNA recombinase